MILVGIEDQSDFAIGIVDVSDRIFFGCPKWEVVAVTEFVERFSGFLDVTSLKDCQWRFTLAESLDFGEFLHIKGKVDGSMR